MTPPAAEQKDRLDADYAREATVPASKPRRGRRRILRNTAVLPSLFTLGNALAGFGAIHFATKTVATFDGRLENLATAGWLLVTAMVCDMLDGRVARMTRMTSDFGGQLDSLCDAVSFGVAPAIMALRAVVAVLDQITVIPHVVAIERLVWCVAAVYVSCAVLRLARFNVENEPDESAHMDFKGLPSPGAAAAVGATILLLRHLAHSGGGGWLSSLVLSTTSGRLSGDLAMGIAALVLTLVTLSAGLLMVSRMKYAHLVNHYIRGKRPFSYIVKLMLVLVAILVEPFATLAIGTVAYALSGPLRALRTRLRRRAV